MRYKTKFLYEKNISCYFLFFKYSSQELVRFMLSSTKDAFLRLLRNPLLARKGAGKGERGSINVFTRAQHNIASFYNQ